MHRFRYDGTRPARSYTPELPSSRIVSIGKSGGEGRQGLDRPTVVERAIATIPLPYLVTCTVLALLTTGPGYFLAHLIESGGDWNHTVGAVFGSAFELPLWRSIPLIILSIGFDVYLLWLVRHSRLHIARYAKEIAPLLADGEAGVRRMFGHLYWRLPVIGLAAAFGLFFVLLLEPIPSDFGFLDFLIVGLNLVFLPFVDAQVIWNYVATVWGVHRIGREALRLRPLYEDPMLGLRPLGSLSLGATFYFFGALAIIIAEVTLSPDPVRPAYLAFLIVLVLFGAGLLFLPLVSIHRLMATEKRRAIVTASSRAGDVYAPLMARNPTPEPSLHEVRDLLLRTHGILLHREEERRIQTLPTWPFETRAMTRIAAITLTGVVAVVGRAAVDYFLLR